ncbi:MAG: hypothetical protein N4A54_13085 [Peptostreptococcaceae bacterium]|jgi:hypothetical protein|nr:hypothetical protein [Peptostreptococcaceae bacterium]
MNKLKQINNREKLKTILLVFLFFSNLFFLFFNFNLINLDNLYINKFNDEELNSLTRIAVKNTIKPSKTFLHFGKYSDIDEGNHTIIFEESYNLYDDLKPVIKKAFSKQLNIEEIDYEDYINKRDKKSIEFQFKNALSYEFFELSLGLDDSNISKLQEIKQILIPILDDERVYIMTKDLKTYSIEAISQREIEILSSKYYKISESEYKRYYSIKYLYKINNNLLISIDNPEKLPYLTSKSIKDFDKEENIMFLAEQFLGSNLDFAKQIKETSGASSFIYGLGEKTLRISAGGDIEYKNESIQGHNKNLKEAYNSVVNWINKLNIDYSNLYISDYEEIYINNNKLYKFVFDYKLNGYNIKSKESDYALEIAAIKDDVYIFKSNIKTTGRVIYTDNGDNEKEQILNIDMILGKNLNLIKSIQGYLGFRDQEASTYMFGSLKDVNIIYFESASDIYFPSWYIEIDDTYYIFDIYKGEVLKYGKL